MIEPSIGPKQTCSGVLKFHITTGCLQDLENLEIKLGNLENLKNGAFSE